MWLYESTVYQIYPIGFCGAPRENDGKTVSRIRKVMEWTNHLIDLGIDVVLLNPVWDSDRHGYDTRDFQKVDVRLGTNEDFKEVCDHLKKQGIRIILDGVFNHVGRGFWAFQDVLKNREKSLYKNWFSIDFGRDNGYGDNLYYEGWEGHYELVKLNLQNPEVIEHIFNSIESWVKEFDVDGLRLDVAYCLDKDFIRKLRRFCNKLKPEFVLIGEMIHGDYRWIVNNDMLHSCTNYECYKGIYSSINAKNLFEISYSLNRQFGLEDWTLYKGLHLLNFVDNHDVSRIASILTEKMNLAIAYGLLFTMPGVPCIYYGSEWGEEGEKKDGDEKLRPCFDEPKENQWTRFINKLIGIRKSSKALCYGTYRNQLVTNGQLVFERTYEKEKALVCLNLDESAYETNLNLNTRVEEKVTGEEMDLSKPIKIPPHGVRIYISDK